MAKAEKALLTAELQRLDNRIELSRGRILKTEYADKKEKQKLLDTLATRQKWVKDLRSGLEKVDVARDRKKLQYMVTKITNEWNLDQNVKFRRTLLDTKILRTDEVIEKSEKIIAQLEAEVTRMQNKGLETEEVKAHIASARTHLKDSRNDRAKVSATVKKITPQETGVKAVAQEARRQLKSSQNNLKKMEGQLVTATKKVKNFNAK
jgi:chromosome segregation ATPase